jgi:hypothetical protein
MPHNDHPLYPTTTPLYLEKDWHELPSEIRKLHAAFKNKKLSEIEKELGNARNLVGSEYPEEIKDMDLETRKELLKKGLLQINNRKIYITGGAVRNLMINHLHGHAHPNRNYDLATDASPLALKIILNAAKAQNILRDEKVSLREREDDLHKLDIVFQKGRDHIVFKTSTFPSVNFKDAPRMYLDYRKRNFTGNGLYYDIEKGHVIDHGHGLAHIAEKKVIPISGDMKEVIKKNPLNAITYISNLTSVNESPSLDTMDELALKNANLGQVDQGKITDAFINGLTHAVDKKSFISLLDKTSLLPKIFKMSGLNTDISKVSNKIPTLTVAQLFKNYFTSAQFLKNKLSQLGYNPGMIHDIIFLVKLPHYNTKTNDLTRDFSIEQFHDDHRRTNLSINAVEDYIKGVGLPNAIIKELKGNSFSNKYLSEPEK